MMHHNGAKHDVEGLIEEVETFDHADSEFDWQIALSRFDSRAGNLLRAWINAEDATRSANALLDLNRERSSAATHIQHLLSELDMSEIGSSLTKFPQFAAKQE